ncbi:MAG: SPOR domain-containing protein [Rhodospirillaceae bacterium]|nr:SPOR domain-containing protein [Rhodospirillaceae bacterium]
MAIDRDGDGPPLRKTQSKADDGSALRATPFTDDVFDDDYYRGRGRSSGGSPFGLIVGVIVGAAVAGGAAWFVLKDQSSPLTVSGNTPVIKADPSPYKIKPENPGGMQVENQDKTVYDRVAKTDAPNRVENLLPAPEQPKTPPKVEPKPTPPPAKPAPVEEKVAEAKAPPTAEAAKAEPKTAEQEKKDDLAIMISALEGKMPPADAKPAEAKPVDAKPVDTKPVETKPAETKAPEAALADQPPRPAPPNPTGLTSGFQVQLAAAKSEEAAMSEWNRIKNRHPDLLGTLTPAVVRADLGDKGVFFRLRAGFLPDKAASDTLCAAMTAQGDACLVIKP